MLNNWGKSCSIEDKETNYHLLVYHCLDVAAVGTVLLEKDKLLAKKNYRINRLQQGRNSISNPFYSNCS